MSSLKVPAPVTLPLPDSELLYFEATEIEDSELLARLINETPWRCDDITVFGKTYPQPRLVAWYGEPDACYTYSGIRHQPLPWTATLLAVREIVETLSKARFNSVLLNYYRDQNDSMGLHADDEPELGDQPTIASLSLGQERSLYFKHRTRNDIRNFILPLPSSSLLIMKGQTQRNWKHGMRKLKRRCGARLNLTFRLIHPGGAET